MTLAERGRLTAKLRVELYSGLTDMYVVTIKQPLSAEMHRQRPIVNEGNALASATATWPVVADHVQPRVQGAVAVSPACMGGIASWPS